ncbi:MAG: hypothetical protein QM714_12095 [Nocardioides sp.]|uniref:hypothetical protein n=1 Tax=Nocardioides sp. TaxID=35761 RepID=UPI0039E59914
MDLAVDWDGMENGSAAAGGIGLLPKGFNLEHGSGQVTRCGTEPNTALAVVLTRADPRKTSYVRNLNLVYRADGRRHSVAISRLFGICGKEEHSPLTDCNK